MYAVTEGTGEFVSAKLSQLNVGATLRLPIYDAQSARRTLLLAAGCTLSESQLRALRRRGILSVLLHRSEFERLTSGGHAAWESSGPPPEQRPQLRTTPSMSPPPRTTIVPGGWRNDGDSFHHSVARPSRPDRNPEYAAAFERSYVHATETTKSLVDILVKYKELDSQQVTGLSQRHLDEIRVDLDEFVFRGLQPIIGDYPSRHSLQSAMLACSIGTTMGLNRDELLELGFGCLLHDAGMLLIPGQLLSSPEMFTTAQRLEVQKHCMHAANLLNHCRNVPHGARHVVYQMHERMNGSGYPRQRAGNQIHILARIAAVADTYLALVSPRPYRHGLEPYQAVEKLLFSTRQGLFDASAVRALIHTVSMFPIGSGVALNDGRIGRVIRANQEQFARPIVELLAEDDSEYPREVVNLAELPELAVVSTTPLPRPGAAELEPAGKC
jgi:HD-GYP domain-containing protein (c-di-GMP phosphodiesterase class II)